KNEERNLPDRAESPAAKHLPRKEAVFHLEKEQPCKGAVIATSDSNAQWQSGSILLELTHPLREPVVPLRRSKMQLFL
ncbi:MAG TPA: hypothetical protein VGK36_18020, partial [Candidatus Angelobacter sp.]